jgi:predicted RNA-binding Zn-ribbon protein involved in translation (DUF1610 family)
MDGTTEVRGGASDEPYCGNCGYALKGLTESSKCPECGRPLVEILTRRRFSPDFGKRYRSKATLFGLPVLDIAVGPKDGEMRGKARGIIAIGDIATGGIAIGGVARGVVAVGGVALGLFSFGGLAVGLVAALGGLAVGGMATGGGAIGVLANGGGAAGVYAQGGGALGWFVRDARTFARPLPRPDPFDRVSWFFGPWPPSAGSAMYPVLVNLAITLAAAAAIGLVACYGLWRARAPGNRDSAGPGGGS